MNIQRRNVLALAAAATLCAAVPASAQNYPSRPVKLVVPFPPGGPTDLVARLLGQKLGDALGQSVIIENKAGAGGTIGSDSVAKAPADGYTLLYGSTSTLAISPSVYKSLGYDPKSAFAPVALVSHGQQILVVHPGLPVSDLKGLVDYSMNNPAKLSYSSAGNGTPGHLAGELLKQVTGISAVHVPYKGGAPALQATLAGEVQFTVDVVPTSLPHIRAAKLKPIAIVSSKRSEVLPDVPTVDQAGFKPISADFWSGVVAPAGTPAAIIQRLNGEIQRIVSMPDFRARLAEVGAEPQQGSPRDFARFIDEEMRKWAAVAQTAGVKLD